MPTLTEDPAFYTVTRRQMALIAYVLGYAVAAAKQANDTQYALIKEAVDEITDLWSESLDTEGAS